MYFSSDHIDVRNRARYELPYSAVRPRTEESLNQIIHANRRITTRELCMQLNV
jgi:hypothetical protein